MNNKNRSKPTHDWAKQSVTWLTVAVCMSLLGLALHNLQEFGAKGLNAPDHGMIPMLVLQMTIQLIWLFSPTRRKTMTC